MFPTTVWTTIRKAGDQEPDSLERFGERYRAPVFSYLRRRGFAESDAEDLCQEVFARIFSSGVLARADAEKGKFRSLLLTITGRTIQDRLRRRTEPGMPDHEPAAPHRDQEFDREWILHLAERAMRRLRDDGSTYYAVLEEHLRGGASERNRLWIARRKLAGLIRDEVAFTCHDKREFDGEMAYLAPFLRPARKKNVRHGPASCEERGHEAWHRAW